LAIANGNLAVIRPLETGYATQQCGLATSTRAEKYEKVTSRNLDGYVVNSPDWGAILPLV
jgi:hypothetical protein